MIFTVGYSIVNTLIAEGVSVDGFHNNSQYTLSNFIWNVNFKPLSFEPK